MFVSVFYLLHSFLGINLESLGFSSFGLICFPFPFSSFSPFFIDDLSPIFMNDLFP